MSEKRDDGGPAFPVYSNVPPQGPLDNLFGSNGMSLRDWFAGQALSELIETYDMEDSTTCDYVARRTYWLADAMLRAREAADAD